MVSHYYVDLEVNPEGEENPINNRSLRLGLYHPNHDFEIIKICISPAL